MDVGAVYRTHVSASASNDAIAGTSVSCSLCWCVQERRLLRLTCWSSVLGCTFVGRVPCPRLVLSVLSVFSLRVFGQCAIRSLWDMVLWSNGRLRIWRVVYFGRSWKCRLWRWWFVMVWLYWRKISIWAVFLPFLCPSERYFWENFVIFLKISVLIIHIGQQRVSKRPL